ncbi:hypothetical protein CK203_060684 [Vitis vinifera]|uniref:Reverse transcriptase/retrotransposon-derived protein RNase H-like domain-containing protein n=1 Tax=Vitis vinifera TaxID=29760 RepID=A0A438GA60_VITVI|nr:hypothetical protein CK203_060684 [Vitis vinifera]
MGESYASRAKEIRDQWCKMIREKKFLHASLQVGGPGEDHFHMSIRNLRIQKNAFRLMQCTATFQRCMLSIFSDMVERIMEVFMDDITIYGRIVLGHIISKQGIEVDKAKVELIVKLPSPTTVKGVRQFLGHAGFYRSFEELKLFLTTAPIVRAPNWQLPFEVMCDASDFAIGAVLGQREDGKPYVIYYEQNVE